MNAVSCPRCGGSMVSRTNRRTGEAFLGCLAYPKCKGTLQSVHRYPLCPICGKSMSVHSNDSSWGLEDVLSCGDVLTDEKGTFAGYCRGFRKILTAPWNCPFCARELVDVEIQQLSLRSEVFPKLSGKLLWTTDELRVTNSYGSYDSHRQLILSECTELRESKSVRGKFRYVDPYSPRLEKHDSLYGNEWLNYEWDRICQRERANLYSYFREHGKPWYWNEDNTYLACQTRGCNGLRVLRPGSADHEAYRERCRRLGIATFRYEQYPDDANYTDENQAYYYRTITNSRTSFYSGSVSEDSEQPTLRERTEALRQMPRSPGFNPTEDDIEYFEYLEQYDGELRIGRTSREARFTRDWKCVNCATNFELPMEPKSVPEIWWTYSPAEVKCPKCHSSEGTIPIVSLS